MTLLHVRAPTRSPALCVAKKAKLGGLTNIVFTLSTKRSPRRGPFIERGTNDGCDGAREGEGLAPCD